jgi:hypothetical protein
MYASKRRKYYKNLRFMIVFLIKVSNEEALNCDDEISMDELCKALIKMTKNKCPGCDGLTVSFYCIFFIYFEKHFMKYLT